MTGATSSGPSGDGTGGGTGDAPPEPIRARAESGSPRPSRRRRLVARLLALGVSGLLALGALEVWARTAHPFGIQYYAETSRYLGASIQLPPEAAHPAGRVFENRAGNCLELVDFSFCTDANGLRRSASADPAATPDEGSKRILFLGDSVTLGWGVDDEDSWVRTLEREGEAADGRPLACLNAGHLVYNTVQQADWAAAHAERLRPEAIVLTFVTNDVQDDHWALYQELVAAQSGDAAELSPGQRLAVLWSDRLPGTRRLWLFARERMRARSEAEADEVPVEDHPGYDEGWARCEGALQRLHAQARALGVPLLVFDHTTPRIPAVQRWCEASGVPWFDLNFTPEEWAEDVRVSKADSHANALGNRYLYAKAHRALAAQGLLAAPR